MSFFEMVSPQALPPDVSIFHDSLYKVTVSHKALDILC